jgi:SAM-dependent methyltransferase
MGGRSLPGDGTMDGSVRCVPGSTAQPANDSAEAASSRPLPPEHLRWRVAGTESAAHFDVSGQQSRRDIERALAVVGRTLHEFTSVLDFGCGCGRIARWLDDLPAGVSLHGVDIDAEAVAWAARHIPHARFSVNRGEPPLDFQDDAFDLVLNHSVFTHLPEHLQDAWLAELNRVTRPDGVLLLTVSGEHPFAGFLQTWLDAGADPAFWEERYRREGLVYVEDDSWVGGPFPDFYHSTFHAPWYVFEHWTKFLELHAYVVRGSLGFQDLLVFRPSS